MTSRSLSAIADAGPIAPARPNAAPPAALDWRRIPAVTSSQRDSFAARARRIVTDLSGFIRASRLDAAEAEIVKAMQDLRELRMSVRQMRAEAKADQRAGRSVA